MADENGRERSIDEIIARVVAEAHKLSDNEGQQAPGENPEPIPEASLSDWGPYEDLLNRAVQNAHTGTQLPSMTRYNKGFRWAARLMGRIVLYFSQVITVPQRLFNQNIFSAVRSGFDNHRNDIRILEKRKTRLLTLEKAWNDLEDELMTEVRNRKNALHAGFKERDDWLHNQQHEITENKEWLHNHQNEITENKEWLHNHQKEITENKEWLHNHQKEITENKKWLHNQQREISAIKEWTGNLEKAAGDVSERLLHVDERLATADKLRKTDQLAYERLQANLTLQERRLGLLLEEVRRRLPEPLNNNQLETFADQSSHLLDSLYVHFEDRYRGTRQEIKEKLGIYLPFILKAQVGEKECPVLDIGCGRGEWLELLKTENLTARGLDLNQVAVKQCKKLGLEVVQSDVFDYLVTVADESVGAVTGFHFIEHISFGDSVKLLDEALRVLKTGGLIIFETPNPRNILVGSGDFYRDPTHRNPIHPETISSVAEARGFVRTGSYFLIRQPDGIEFVEAKDYRFDLVEDYINVSRDFALIGYKA